MTESETQAEQPAPLPRAGLLRRLAALLYDGFLVAAIWIGIGFIWQFIFGPDTNTLVDGQVQTDPVLGWILFLSMLASAFAFYLYFWTRGGQTLGMLAWRIKLESLDGKQISPQQALRRFVAAWPAFFLLLIGYLWIRIDPRGDALHDKLSGSKVVLLPKSHRPF